MLLEAGGHAVSVASCPRDAMRSIEHGETDLVIMDLKFSNARGEQDSKEGLALIRGIRECRAGLPVIVLSGWPEAIYGTPEETMVSRVLVKPVLIGALLETINDLLQAQQVSARDRSLP
jgi:CheY-like chemotaxis protein